MIKADKKIFLFISFFLVSCSVRISTELIKTYPLLDYKQEVKVYEIQDEIPGNSEFLGVVKVEDAGFTLKCGYQFVLEKAKMEARKTGGNAIKIVEHLKPDLYSSCHRITAKILKTDTLAPNSGVNIQNLIDSTIDYAVLYVYRNSKIGPLVSYNLYLGDSVICRVNNEWCQEIKITKKGLNEIWAKTESKSSLPIEVKSGQKYYLRCGVVMGLLVGRPSLEYVDSDLGKIEYNSIKSDR
jgi:hypothetical protein